MQTNFNLLTWASIISCRKLNPYVVALEADEAIFKALLHPMIQTTNVATSEIIPTSPLVDDEEPVLLSFHFQFLLPFTFLPCTF
jgi:hypothetical protein